MLLIKLLIISKAGGVNFSDRVGEDTPDVSGGTGSFTSISSVQRPDGSVVTTQQHGGNLL